MTLPNFLTIGAAKSGTTAIYTYIKQHPDIFMSTPKELRFFSYSGPYPKNLSEDYIHRGVTTLEEYQQYFKDVGTEKIIGEASPMYLYRPGTAEKIKKVIPNVKMLAILRNPINRAFSSYMHAIRDWRESADSFKSALDKEQDRIDAGWGMLWHYKNAGFYYQQLKRYYQIFNSDQIKVVLYDDLVLDSQALIKDVFTFLDIDQSFEPDTSSHPNISGFPKSNKFHEFMRKLFMQDNPIKRISRVLFPKSFRRQVMEKMREPNLEKRKMPQEVRNELIDVFHDDIINLEKLIQQDLSLWLK
ncbi:MAG: sulfotransferase [Chloroflexota bacterium]|nr:sulfotransferase [Chloroflexota bacterium]